MKEEETGGGGNLFVYVSVCIACFFLFYFIIYFKICLLDSFLNQPCRGAGEHRGGGGGSGKTPNYHHLCSLQTLVSSVFTGYEGFSPELTTNLIDRYVYSTIHTYITLSQYIHTYIRSEVNLLLRRYPYPYPYPYV